MSTAPGIFQQDQAELPDFAGGVDLFFHVARRVRQLGRPPVQSALWHQVRRGALDFAGLTAAMGALAGFFTVATIGVGFGLGVAMGVRVMQVLVLGQLAGFACALLLVAGPGTAATFELGLMRQQGELRTLRLMGIDPRDYLVLPRVIGFAFALLVLAFVFQLAAVVGGFGLSALLAHISIAQQVDALVATLKPSTLAVSAIRSLVLGGAIGVLVCQQGLVAPFSPTETPRIARHLLSRALVALVVVHGLSALVMS